MATTPSTTPPPSPLLALSPSQVNWAHTAQWRGIVKQALVEARFSIPAFLTEDMDALTQTATVQIAIQEQARTSTGPAWFDIPPIILVPVLIPRGGGFSVTLPLKKGNEGLLIFCDACIDSWWQSGTANSQAPTAPVVNGAAPPPSGSQRQNEVRRHHVHDCGFYPTSISQPNKLASYSADTLQIRSDDGLTIMELDQASAVNITAPGGVTVTTGGGQMTTSADAAVAGNLTVGSGASGTFSTSTGQTVTVQNGIVIDIST